MFILVLGKNESDAIIIANANEANASKARTKAKSKSKLNPVPILQATKINPEKNAKLILDAEKMINRKTIVPLFAFDAPWSKRYDKLRG